MNNFKESTFIEHDERKLQSAAISEKFRDKLLKLVSVYDDDKGCGEELRFVFEDGSKFIIENFNHDEPLMFRIEL